MDITNLSCMIRSAIQSVAGCYITTTDKKKLGFVPKNKWDIKWGQVDVNETKIRIVIDTIPGKYTEEEIRENIELPLRLKGSRTTGFLIKKTNNSAPSHDAIEISIYKNYLSTYIPHENY